MISMDSDPVHADLEAHALATALRDRAEEMGRDPMVMVAMVLLSMDRDGMLAWIREQRRST
jgi:hypothetical protein